MDFDKEQKVIIGTMNKVECYAFIKFLESEIIRHRRDIADAWHLIDKVRRRIEQWGIG